MNLQNLLAGYINSDSIEINFITDNSSEVIANTLFIAYRGTNLDGKKYIHTAIEKGAVAVIADENIPNIDIPVYTYDKIPELLPIISSRFYNSPDKSLNMIGITGTDGKTTTASIIQHLLGINKCGYIGTNGVRFKNYFTDYHLTTPKILQLNHSLKLMLDNDIQNVAMEVSSQGIELGRVDNIEFDCAIFTNISPEHLDYHKDMDAYLQSKAKLFSKLRAKGSAIINSDDDMSFDHLNKIIERPIYTYGIYNKANLQATNIKYSLNGMAFDLLSGNKKYHVNTNLHGKFNIYNILAALASCHFHYKLPLEELIKKLQNIPEITGRMNIIQSDPFNIVVDFAHTPNALDSVLEYIKEITKGRTTIVFGSAGKKDKLKRPLMGTAVNKYADNIIITSEDPRNEDPEDIANQIIKGIDNKNKVKIILDRQEAIEYAVKTASKDDTILITGKGDEKTQEISGQIVAHNDIDVVLNILETK